MSENDRFLYIKLAAFAPSVPVVLLHLQASVVPYGRLKYHTR